MNEDTKTYRIQVKGISPLIMNSAERADPLNKWKLESSKITAKGSKKTEVDHLKLQEIDFLGSLYWSEELNGLYIPTDNLRKMILEAARACDKMGAKKQVVGILFTEYLGYPLITENRSDMNALRDDPRRRYFKIVSVQRAKVPKVRAIFKEWEFEFQIILNTRILNESTIRLWLDYAGDRVGLGDRRPYAPTPGEFGRFGIEQFEEVK